MTFLPPILVARTFIGSSYFRFIKKKKDSYEKLQTLDVKLVCQSLLYNADLAVITIEWNRLSANERGHITLKCCDGSRQSKKQLTCSTEVRVAAPTCIFALSTVLSRSRTATQLTPFRSNLAQPSFCSVTDALSFRTPCNCAARSKCVA